MERPVEIIESIKQITEPNIRYAHYNFPHHWIMIDKDQDNRYSVFGYLNGLHPSFIYDGKYYVKEWTSIKSVKEFLLKCVDSGNYGLRRFK